MVAHTFNLSTGEAEAGWFLWVWDQSCLHNEVKGKLILWNVTQIKQADTLWVTYIEKKRKKSLKFHSQTSKRLCYYWLVLRLRSSYVSYTTQGTFLRVVLPTVGWSLISISKQDNSSTGTFIDQSDGGNILNQASFFTAVPSWQPRFTITWLSVCETA